MDMPRGRSISILLFGGCGWVVCGAWLIESVALEALGLGSKIGRDPSCTPWQRRSIDRFIGDGRLLEHRGVDRSINALWPVNAGVERRVVVATPAAVPAAAGPTHRSIDFIAARRRHHHLA